MLSPLRAAEKLRILRLCFWPKAIFTVAWGNAPGTPAKFRWFGRRPYSPPCIRQCEHGLQPKEPSDTGVLGRCPRLRWEQAFGQAWPDCQMRNFEGRSWAYRHGIRRPLRAIAWSANGSGAGTIPVLRPGFPSARALTTVPSVPPKSFVRRSGTMRRSRNPAISLFVGCHRRS
jgi:hypothetical protein